MIIESPIVKRFANLLADARATDVRGDASSLAAPDYDEALAIQRRVLPLLGPLSGFKVGAFRPGQPAMAPIPSARTFPSGSDVPVREMLGIELEVGFEILRAPEPAMRHAPQDFLLPRIVLELCDQRFDGDALDPAVKLADMQLNDGVVLGPALADWDGSDFGRLNARLRCGDTTVVDGEVIVPGGSALSNLWTLLDHLGNHCGGIKVGQTVITGSVSGLTEFPPGTQVDGMIVGFAPISCRLVQA
ncbi:2-keto-4-pentenoate hydratase [Poseidonocella pacifica]|uniref:2-keto-4-pentenoate hydratase n=1 Tax=Poseidonocella pacifica TaxID=871651 RepID=A0A1I0VBX1_9RHOB|nr:hydratase [Poseidonocella pacifica]SFA73835.1 2-keto-4-pentenoate hydratase [Poseidonocella pacifica]